MSQWRCNFQLSACATFATSLLTKVICMAVLRVSIGGNPLDREDWINYSNLWEILYLNSFDFFHKDTQYQRFYFAKTRLVWKGRLWKELASTTEGNGTPLQYSCLENPMDGGAWWAAVHGVARSKTRLSDFTLTFHFYALEEEMATHSSVLAWRIPGTEEPGGLLSMGSHRVGHDWSDLAAAAQREWN